MTSVSLLLLRHYVDYLQQPAVFVTGIIVLGGLFLLWFENYKLGTLTSRSIKIPGCYRLGLYDASYLDSKVEGHSRKQGSIGQTSVTGNATVKALFTYPVKSCRGIELKASEVLGTGLKYDRTFTFAQLRPVRERSGNGHADDHEPDNSPAPEWQFVTQREFPRLAMLTTELWVPDPRHRKAGQNKDKSKLKPGPSEKLTTTGSNESNENEWVESGGCLILRFPYKSAQGIFGFVSTEIVTLRIPLVPTSRRANRLKYTSEQLRIWLDCPLAINMTNEIEQVALVKLTKFLGARRPLGLFRVDDNNLRQISRSLPQSRPNEKFYVGFTDAFPVHLLGVSSVRAVNDMLPKDSAIKQNLDPRRFRANIYITGPPAYAEEQWKRVNIGRCIQPRSRARRDKSPSPANHRTSAFVETDGEYHVACRTARCKVPNVDQDNGERDVNEPDSTLRKNRDVDKGASPHPVLGMQLIPLFPQGVVRVGDEIDVLERGEHYYEKMF